MKLIKNFCLVFLIWGLVLTAVYAQQNKHVGTLRGQVLDESEAGLVGAEVKVTDTIGKTSQTITSEKGSFEFSQLDFGTYILEVNVPGFSPYKSGDIQLRNTTLPLIVIHLSVANVVEQVNVDANAPINLSSENNASALVFKGKNLEALPDDPDELASALQELAGPAAGPNGAQLYIDGFTGIKLPPKSSIREIRVNTNPFSAEYDRLGFGRIEILTKPGIEQLHGEAFFNFNDESLNARNAFAPFRAPLQVRRYGGNVTGSLIPKKSTFFIDFERRDIDENATINATVLDSNFVPTPFSTVVLTPQKLTTFTPRVDYQLGDKTTLVGRYSFTNNGSENQGIGNFSLPSRAYRTNTRIHAINFTATTILTPSVINEVRLQLIRQSLVTIGDNSTSALNVVGAFLGGGPQIGSNNRIENKLEFQDYISLSLNNHNIKTGIRLRGVHIADSDTANFGGTFTFAGDVNRDPTTGFPTEGQITSLEQLRRTLQKLPGYKPSQFTLNAGDPFVSVNQFDVGVFAQDEWRIRQNLSLSLGLRYEAQTNLSAKYNFAPRVAFAYSPYRTSFGKSMTVIRGGFGIFYDRFDESLTLNERRLDGNHIIQYFTSNPSFFPIIPAYSELDTKTSISRQVNPELQTPYVLQAAVGVEQQLPWKLTTSMNYIWSRGIHQLRSRNINAPLPGTFTDKLGSGIRPLGNIGDIYQYESNGFFQMQQLRIGVTRSLGQNFTLFSNYTFTKADSNTDGVNTFPANSYNLSDEYSRSILQVKHQLFIGGSVVFPYGVRMSPFIVIRSGRPFNITTGRDSNRDTVFAERPSFAISETPGSIATSFGTFNPNPALGDTLIPRNFGDGPGFASVNLAISRTFGFGIKQKDGVVPSTGETTQIMRGGIGERPRGQGHGGGRGNFGEASTTDNRFNLTATIRIFNLLNKVNLNGFTGSLTSPVFGQANSASDGRRIEGQLRFRF